MSFNHYCICTIILLTLYKFILPKLSSSTICWENWTRKLQK